MTASEPGQCRGRLSCLLVVALLWSPFSAAEITRLSHCPHADASPARATVVIIIDDLGNRLEEGREVVGLPGKLNVAILPHTRGSMELADLAHRGGKEILLHAPMSNLDQKPLGPGALTSQMSESAFRKSLIRSIHNTPHVRGVNNHMGSELTQMPRQMTWLMQELARHGLYFVDSRTSVNTVAANMAAEVGIPYLSRHVFLDNDATAAAIDERFQHLLSLARRDGLAVAIGHPYKATITYLREAIPRLSAQGFDLAFVSEVVEKTSPEKLTILTVSP